MKAKRQISKKIDDGGNTPRHCYFWIAHLADGSVIPEYDFDSLRHNKVRNLPVDFVSRFSWYPVTLTMVERVMNLFGEVLKLPRNDSFHSVDIDLDKGDRLRVKPVWRNDISFLGSHGVMTRYALFKTTRNGDVGFFVTEDGRHVEE